MFVWRSELEYQQRLVGHWQAIAARATADAIKEWKRAEMWIKRHDAKQWQLEDAWEDSRRISAILAESDQRGVEVYTRMMEAAYGVHALT